MCDGELSNVPTGPQDIGHFMMGYPPFMAESIIRSISVKFDTERVQFIQIGAESSIFGPGAMAFSIANLEAKLCDDNN